MPKIIRVGIVGSRRRDTAEDKKAVEAAFRFVLTALSAEEPEWCDPWHQIELVSGGCPKGGDRFAKELSKELAIPIIEYFPDKSKLDEILKGKNPRAAYAAINFERNTTVAEKSDWLIACVAEDRKGGTENTITKFKALGKEEKLILC